jgi:hypothetical protein
MPQSANDRLATALRLLREPLQRVGRLTTSGFRPPSTRSLPEWFVRNRVQGHTRLRLSPQWHDTPQFKRAAEGFRAFGAGAFTRHVKSADEDPWWPTALPIGPDGAPLSDRDREINGVLIVRGRSVAGEIIDEAHEQGLRIVPYYWHMTENSLAELYPDWVCRDPDGEPMVHDPRGIHLDITGPYREVVLTRLQELAARGADGLNFDERHLPPEGCWGSALEDAWKAETGEESAPRAETDPLYLEFIEFKARKIEDTFEYWRGAVQAEHPDVVFLVSTTTIPALTDREMTTRLARIADSAKNEYRLALNDGLSKCVFKDNPELAPLDHVRQALGWTVLRDSSGGRPPRIWAPGLADADHAQAFAASLLTFGCIAHMDVDEPAVLGDQAPEEGKTPLAGIRAAFELGDRVSPHLAETELVRWAALHFSERIRNKRRADYRAAWIEVLWPLVGSYQALCEDGLPVGTVNDWQLERGELGGYRVLFLPNPDELTAAQRRNVAAFQARGGVVVENDPGWAWSDPAQRPAAAAAFRAAIRPHADTAPVIVNGGPRGRYAVAYRARNKLVVAVTNNFSWVQVTSPRNIPTSVNQRAPDADGVQVGWRSGVRLPQPGPFTPWPQLRAVEAVTGTSLTVERHGDLFRVRLPKFAFMALLVVSRATGMGPVPFAPR